MSAEDHAADRCAHTAAPAVDLPDFPVPSHDPRAVSDAIRPDARIALSSSGAMVLLRHVDVVAAARDPEVFSSAVSRFLQLPNGLDGEEHAAFRRLIEPYFTAERMAALEPGVREAARQVCAEVTGAAGVGTGAVGCDAVGELGSRFAVRAMMRWLGWPAGLEPTLLEWMADNQTATRSGRLDATADVARRYDEIIRSVLAPRRGRGGDADGSRQDVTAELMSDRALGRPLRDEELVSVLRNWTGGDLGSIALSLGVVLHYLATHRVLQARIRSGLTRRELTAIVDEILRIDDPFVANRRMTTCPVSRGGLQVAAGQRVVLNWTSANRDEEVFGDPDRFDPDGNAGNNLVYGTGPHVCPGRPLATLELCVAVEEIVAAFADITLDPVLRPERSITPNGGFSSVPVVLTPAR
ncbi:cytochrome P450 [Citricoccus sp.]|uniref:cytochrome P450 n=1 Tax=Citricoccus sp. TaxID=1978372 RepID=UPI002627BFD8|nr:cytochrome P450 [Citricoccus sp.]HRO30594.1 cytochrome P450 [Citricoccus sp.]HRO93496.1 cytochrome P450 [Citricoccus sp.]